MRETARIEAPSLKKSITIGDLLRELEVEVSNSFSLNNNLERQVDRLIGSEPKDDCEKACSNGSDERPIVMFYLQDLVSRVRSVNYRNEQQLARLEMAI